MWAVLLVLTLVVGAMPMQAMAYSPWNSNYTQEELALIAQALTGRAGSKGIVKRKHARAELRQAEAADRAGEHAHAFAPYQVAPTAQRLLLRTVIRFFIVVFFLCYYIYIMNFTLSRKFAVRKYRRVRTVFMGIRNFLVFVWNTR